MEPVLEAVVEREVSEMTRRPTSIDSRVLHTAS
jgi:hypothetical protein